MTTLIKASPGDAAMLTELARNIYKEHYLHLWHPGGAEWYMETYAYARDTIEKDLDNPEIEYTIAYEDDKASGYMKLLLTSELAGHALVAAMEVERIYLHKNATGKGLGRKFMQLAMERALQLKKDIIFLKAMDSSTDAIAFYKSLGYKTCGSLQLPLPEFSVMKAEYRGMVILKQAVKG